jgi:beta-lactamase superfamily II metal-dependent hydrolase
MLMNSPVLVAPDFEQPFKLAVDASDIGAGAVLLQEQDGVDHPVSYFSRNLINTSVIIQQLKKKHLQCC